MCNGVGAAIEILDPLAHELASDRTVITFDAPGAGCSPAPAYPYRLPVLAVAIAKAMRQMGFQSFDVLGYSWGGALAQQIALSYPARCRRVVLMCTATFSLSVPPSPLVLMRMVTPRRYRNPDYAVRIAPLIYGGTTRHNKQQVRAVFARTAGRVNRQGYFYQLVAVAGWTSLAWLHCLRQPVLLHLGNDDPLIPALNGAIMHKLIPRATLSLFQGGHLDPLLHAEDHAPQIRSFLSAPEAS
jgi:poly(3-hydroxyalkanoate) depolymerase